MRAGITADFATTCFTWRIDKMQQIWITEATEQRLKRLTAYYGSEWEVLAKALSLLEKEVGL